MFSLGLEQLVTTATGWAGIGIVFLYSFLVAFILPTPSEFVLLAPLDLGIPPLVKLSIIILVSGLGKTAGSFLAFSIGQGVKSSDMVRGAFKSRYFNVMRWSQKQAVKAAQKWGYVGLAVILSIPFYPDTITIYAFSILESDYLKFTIAVFAGSVMRLVITIAFVGSISSVV